MQGKLKLGLVKQMLKYIKIGKNLHIPKLAQQKALSIENCKFQIRNQIKWDLGKAVSFKELSMILLQLVRMKLIIIIKFLN
jgi:hypothetical protein